MPPFSEKSSKACQKIFVYLRFMTLDPAQLDALRTFFASRPVLRAYLFGSYGRGDADAQSDLDLLVDLDYSQRIGLNFVQMRLDLEHLLRIPVDLVSSEGVSRRLRPIIDAEKVLIYVK